MSTILRTSALPKLAVCPCFMGQAGDAGPYAARGTMADVAFRLANEGKPLFSCSNGHYFESEDRGKCPHCGDVATHAEDPLESIDARVEKHAAEHGIPNKPVRVGIEWAIAKMRELAGPDVKCITDESQLTVEIEGLDAAGTADGNAPAAQAGFDLKTGKIANYMEQMAGYALGFMAQGFFDHYTMHLLFMDHETVITHKFSYDEAKSIVAGIRRNVLDANRKPVINSYCTWCALATTCTARTDAAQKALEYANGLNVREGLGAIVKSSAALGDFLSACDALKPFEQVAQGKARWRLEDELPVRGWGLTRVQGIKHVTSASAIQHTKKLPKGEELTIEKILLAIETMTPYQFKRIMESVNKPLPKRWSKQGRPNTYLMRQTQNKNTQ